MRPLLFLCALVIAPACSPALIWRGMTPDRRLPVRVEEDGNGQWVRIGNVRGQSYDGIGADALAVSARGNRIAYPARRGSAWVVVHDGREIGSWNGVGELSFSPDGEHLAFSAELDGAWHVVVDGRAGPRFDTVYAGSLTWSAGSLAYAAGRGSRAHAVRDQVPGPGFDGVGRLAFAGGRLVYVGRLGAAESLIVDGNAGPPAPGIGEVAISANGAHIAHVAEDGAVERLFVDDRPVAVSQDGHFSLLHVDGDGRVTFAASANGWAHVVRHIEVGRPHAAITELVTTPAGRWAYVAREADGTMSAVVDGVTQLTGTWIGNLVASPDGERVAYLARRKGHAVVVRDGTETRVDAVVQGTLAWSQDSRHWACLAGDAKTRDIFVSIDGRKRRLFDVGELVSIAERMASSGSPRDGTQQLRDIVAGELELALAR